ncbi:hypothetical protein ACLE20_10500 [Rhizobium sp. YIM 134829]|uniref:hypothetical protein n=1 Tax=Rhizobium sp. YIM 134829 TaxID=3390453 RepID=UPI00397CB4A4
MTTETNHERKTEPMMRLPTSIPVLGILLLTIVAPAQAASDCQPIFDAYAAMYKMPAVKRTITVPGMADAPEMVLTPDALYSRVGPKDSWGKMKLDEAARAIMKKGTPSPETVNACQRIGSSEMDGIAGTAYEFTPPKLSGNVPGERITVLLDDNTGLPLIEKALKAATVAKIEYDGVTAPLP